ncbi:MULTISPECIES: amine dehydrogenase large subunit [unclassified Burkholderia]|uniref:amine dehydrogenase large subunit n=1 Tax=unclassified Burkholderia TaxID=2613784 RepID=UPI000F58E4B2|nr:MULTISPECIES: amine dehydrogenase large subunit [unclassified Burkholderia]RQR41767.1 amine dehydrogenase [Burkholderia sp. Bp9131]RQR76460.1 amine dehydrogenase [Burkholderia sp. Bp9015]RQR99783.1 amine dehydrogenase [Burkholderia sp. Bp8994]RQS28367.1 amine dehydrogenase [Burkholderia sp. Bp8995]RQS42952.1 amine dehydrogenase [Burkholderia sp. Bp8990]
MRTRRRTAAFAATLAFAAAWAGSADATEKPEELVVQKMPPWHPHAVYVVDIAMPTMTDGRIFVYDADAKKLLGQIDGGFAPGLAISPDHKTSFIATTYFSRGSHGTRTDVVEMTDNTTLDHTGEIVIPAKHGQHVPSPYNTAFSADGKRLYVANITPAASVTVIDAVSKQVLSEIDTAACVLAYPSGNDRFTALCESGKALTVTLDANGKEVKRTMSDAFIDVDNDPAFINASRYQGGYLFTTYHGNVRSADFGGARPAFGKSWSLLTDAERAEGWRPGGMQQTAVQVTQNRYYVLMHKGGDGTHKDPGTQVWIYDLKTKQRVARWDLAQQKVDPLVSIQVSEDDKPLFYGLTGTSDLVVMDAHSGKLQHVEKQIGSTPTLLVNP